MHKLRLSFKLLSEIPKNLPLQPPLCKTIVTSLAETNPKHVFNSSITQPGSFSHIWFGASRSARSHHSVSEGFSGFIANPVFLKKILSNAAQLKNQSRGFRDHVALMRSQFSRGHFQVQRHNISRWRRWKSWIPAEENLIVGLVLANAAVFMLWRCMDPVFMEKNFTISVDNFTSGRMHTLITSAFSHVEFGHLFFNMLGLYVFGTSIGRRFGSEFLLKLYLAGALGGSIFYLAHHAFMPPVSTGSGMWYVDPKTVSALGASGAVNAIMLLEIFLSPTATYYYNFFIPVPAILLGAFLIGKDLLRVKQNDMHIAGAAHLGGAAVAALTWVLLKRGRI